MGVGSGVLATWVAFGLGVVVGGVGLRRLVYYLFGWRSEIDMLPLVGFWIYLEFLVYSGYSNNPLLGSRIEGW